MDVHIDNVVKIDADVYLLAEMCGNRLNLFRDYLGTSIVRIKNKDQLFVTNKKWDPKIESTTSVNDKIQSKTSHYFAKGVVDGTLTDLPVTVDENDVINSLGLMAPPGVAAKKKLVEDTLSQLYNCNINLLTGKRGDVILVWTVHWPVQKRKSGAYYDEIVGVFNNIIEYLRKNPDTSCIIIGDFNSRGGVNGQMFIDCFNVLTRERPGDFLSSHVSGNDGFMCALNKTFYTDANASEPVLTTVQTTSAHAPMLLTLTETVPVQPPKQDEQVDNEGDVGEKDERDIGADQPVRHDVMAEEEQYNVEKSVVEPPVVKYRYVFSPVKITTDVIVGMMGGDPVLDADAKAKLAGFIHKIYQNNPLKISETAEVASAGMAKRFSLVHNDVAKKAGYMARIEIVIPEIIEQMRTLSAIVMNGGYRSMYAQIKMDYQGLV